MPFLAVRLLALLVALCVASSASGTGTDSAAAPSVLQEALLQIYGQRVQPPPAAAAAPDDCPALFARKGPLERDPVWPPPPRMPLHLEDIFLLGGRAQSHVLYHANQYNGGEGLVWTQESLNHWQSLDCCGGYKRHDCYGRLNRHAERIRGGRGIVIGSELPWAEAYALRLGARTVTTVEYRPIDSRVPAVRTITPARLADRFANRLRVGENTSTDSMDSGLFEADFAISYSSVEHGGLGRYGDGLNPWGDLESLRRVRCLLRRGGVLFLAVPVGPDAVVWNSHRVYGELRLRLLLEGWEALDLMGHLPNVTHPGERLQDLYTVHQPIWVLRKP